jgi:predicted lipoprotein with Yx(FWY)xxD motif
MAFIGRIFCARRMMETEIPVSNEKEVTMRKISYILMAAVILVFFAATVMAMHHAIKIAQKDDVGKYFTDTEGKALYWFKKDSPGKSACTGACVDKWPLYYAIPWLHPRGCLPAISERSKGRTGNRRRPFAATLCTIGLMT